MLIPACDFAVANEFAMNEGAYGPEPMDVSLVEESSLRLVAESLVIHLGSYETYVEARFEFQNTNPDSSVEQLSGFPDISLGEDYDAYMRLSGTGYSRYEIPGTMGSLEDMKTFIDGEQVESTLGVGYALAADTATGYLSWRPADSATGRGVGWYLLNLTASPGESVILERHYRTRNGLDGLGGAHFSYITFTGGAWKGTIGRLVADVYLEDSLTADLIDWTPPSWRHTEVAPPKEEWTIESPTHLKLVWIDFEPSRDKNRQYICLVWRPEGFFELDRENEQER
jgi:hypothetical protein